MTTTNTWYIWREAVFQVPVSILQRPKKMDGVCWTLTRNGGHSTSVVCTCNREATATAAWKKAWNLTGRQANPTHVTKFPKTLAFLYYYAIDMVYITQHEQNESPLGFRKRIYTTLHTMALAVKGAREVRIVKLKPDTPGPRCGRTFTLCGYLRT